MVTGGRRRDRTGDRGTLRRRRGRGWCWRTSRRKGCARSRLGIGDAGRIGYGGRGGRFVRRGGRSRGRGRPSDEYGPVDILVNNAGVELKKLVEDTSLAEWERVLRTNLTSAFLMSRRVIRGMKDRRRGVIVMNSSVGNFIAATRSSAYGASKAGMMALARSLALEGARLRHPGERGVPGGHRHPHERAEPGAERRPGGHAPVLVRDHAAGTAGNAPRRGPGDALPRVRRVQLRDRICRWSSMAED